MFYVIPVQLFVGGVQYKCHLLYALAYLHLWFPEDNIYSAKSFIWISLS